RQSTVDCLLPTAYYRRLADHPSDERQRFRVLVLEGEVPLLHFLIEISGHLEVPLRTEEQRLPVLAIAERNRQRGPEQALRSIGLAHEVIALDGGVESGAPFDEERHDLERPAA